jgi:hypothetical protein
LPRGVLPDQYRLLDLLELRPGHFLGGYRPVSGDDVRELFRRHLSGKLGPN